MLSDILIWFRRQFMIFTIRCFPMSDTIYSFEASRSNRRRIQVKVKLSFQPLMNQRPVESCSQLSNHSSPTRWYHILEPDRLLQFPRYRIPRANIIEVNPFVALQRELNYVVQPKMFQPHCLHLKSPYPSIAESWFPPPQHLERMKDDFVIRSRRSLADEEAFELLYLQLC